MLIIEVKVFDLTERSSFFVVGSDGLFEMLNEAIIGSECRQYLHSNDAQSAAHSITLKAQQAWQKNMIGYVDDITSIVVFLNSQAPPKH